MGLKKGTHTTKRTWQPTNHVETDHTNGAESKSQMSRETFKNSTIMKKIIALSAIVFMAITFFHSCQKLDDFVWDGNGGPGHGHLLQTKMYSSEVAFKWMDMQLHLIITNPTPFGGTPTQRYFAYGAIALYESVVPGMPAYKSLSGQLNEFPAMPPTLQGQAYSWPVCGNAA